MAITREIFLKKNPEDEKVLEALKVIDVYFKDKYSLNTKDFIIPNTNMLIIHYITIDFIIPTFYPNIILQSLCQRISYGE